MYTVTVTVDNVLTLLLLYEPLMDIYTVGEQITRNASLTLFTEKCA